MKITLLIISLLGSLLVLGQNIDFSEDTNKELYIVNRNGKTDENGSRTQPAGYVIFFYQHGTDYEDVRRWSMTAGEHDDRNRVPKGLEFRYDDRFSKKYDGLTAGDVKFRVRDNGNLDVFRNLNFQSSSPNIISDGSLDFESKNTSSIALKSSRDLRFKIGSNDATKVIFDKGNGDEFLSFSYLSNQTNLSVPNDLTIRHTEPGTDPLRLMGFESYQFDAPLQFISTEALFSIASDKGMEFTILEGILILSGSTTK